MWKHRRKLNNKHGFSLTELLVAILILSMVSSVVAGGIPVAKDAYEKVTLSANAQVMLSTTISALRNEMCTATDVTVGSINAEGKITANAADANGIVTGEAIKYYSPSIKNYSQLTVGKVNSSDATEVQNSILLTLYVDYVASGQTSGANTRRLVSKSAGDNQLYVTYENVSYDTKNKIVSFTDLKVLDKNGNVRAKLKDDVGSTIYNIIKIRLIG